MQRGLRPRHQHRLHQRGGAQRECLVAIAERAREPGDRLARHVHHHEEQLTAGRHDVERGNDVRVAHARREAACNAGDPFGSGDGGDDQCQTADGVTGGFTANASESKLTGYTR